MKLLLGLAAFAIPTMAYSAELQIKINDQLDLASYQTAMNQTLSVASEPVDFRYVVDKWFNFWHVMGYKLLVEGNVRKIEDDTYYLRSSITLTYNGASVSTLADDRFTFDTRRGRSCRESESFIDLRSSEGPYVRQGNTYCLTP